MKHLRSRQLRPIGRVYFNADRAWNTTPDETLESREEMLRLADWWDNHAPRRCHYTAAWWRRCADHFQPVHGFGARFGVDPHGPRGGSKPR